MANESRYRSYIVVPDSNILWAQPGMSIAPVSLDFKNALKSLTPNDDVSIAIPQVVFGELAYQRAHDHLVTLEKVTTGAKKLSEFTGKPPPSFPQEAEIAHHVQEDLRKELQSIGRVKIEETPYETIPWRILVNDAVWRHPPFERGEKSEKGFRDAIILETVKAIVAANTGHNVFLLTNDGRLKYAASQQLGHLSHFAVYETVEEFISFVAAARDRFVPEFVHEVVNKGSAMFFSAEDENSLWYAKEIDSFIRTLYGESYFRFMPNLSSERPYGSNQPEWDIGWIPVGEATAHIGPTKFIGLVGEREFRWETIVWYVRAFQRPAMIGDLIDPRRGPERAKVDWTIRLKWHCYFSDEGAASGFGIDGSSAMYSKVDIRRD